MAEVGLVAFARIARRVAEAVVPAYKSKYSKRMFTQPQLLAVLCLMRYEDWTFREAEWRRRPSRKHWPKPCVSCRHPHPVGRLWP